MNTPDQNSNKSLGPYLFAPAAGTWVRYVYVFFKRNVTIAGLSFVGLTLIVLIWSFIYIKLEADYKIIDKSSKAELQNIVRSFKEHTESSIALADELLRIIKFNYEQRTAVDLKTLNDYFKNGVLDMKYFNQVGVIDKDGIYSYTNIKTQNKIDLSDREHFRVHKEIYPYNLFVSKPVLGRASKRWSIQFTRRINTPDGDFNGVAVVSFDPSYFLSFYKKIDLGSDGFIALLDKDGYIRTLQTAKMSAYNGAVPQITLTPTILENLLGFETTDKIYDGVKRIYSFERIADQPLIVLVGMRESDAFAAYEENKTTYLTFGWVLTALIVVFTSTSTAMLFRARRLNKILHRRNREAEIANKEKIEFANRLTQSEKLAALGQLSAGVAHEINNPIGYVASNINTMKKYFEYILSVLELYKHKEEQITRTQLGDTGVNTPSQNDIVTFEDIHEIKERVNFDFILEDSTFLMNETQEGITRVKTIIEDLKNFSRADAAKLWEKCDIHKAIKSSLNIVNNEVKYRADVKLEFGNIPSIDCIPSQINQVILNLVVNAAQATPEGTRGLITIKTYTQSALTVSQSAEVRSSQSQTENQLQDQFVVIEVSDKGVGITPENVSKIFDPFFTTKKVGDGTGLGLSVSHGIIQRHGGDISVQSVLDQGTCFKIVLPVHQSGSETVHDFEI